MVARGFSQQPGVEYDLTHSPVVSAETFRFLCAMIAINGWTTLQIDIKNAYLNGKMDLDVYVEQPIGFVSRTNPELVCKLIKGLYGLKQAGRIWHEELTGALSKIGFIRSNGDSCLMIWESQIHIVVIAIYVDDLLLAGNSKQKLLEVIKDLEELYQVKNLGEAKFLLGIHVEVTKNLVKLSQKSYIERIIKAYGMADSRPIYSPMEGGYSPNCDTEVIGHMVPYRELVGAIGYVVKQTRPDVAYAYGVLSRKLDCPTNCDWNAAKRVLGYLKTTLDVCLRYSGNMHKTLEVYADSDYAGGAGSKSTSGYVAMIAGGAVAWHSRKQEVVAQSTSEAELIAASTAAKEVVWLLKHIDDFKVEIPRPVVLYEDNQPAIALSQTRSARDKLKHLATKYQYIRELVNNNTMVLKYIPSENMLADIFTKPLPKNKILDLRSKIGCVL